MLRRQLALVCLYSQSHVMLERSACSSMPTITSSCAWTAPRRVLHQVKIAGLSQRPADQLEQCRLERVAGVLFRVDYLHELYAYPVNVTPAQPVEMPVHRWRSAAAATFARAALCQVWKEEGGETFAMNSCVTCSANSSACNEILVACKNKIKSEIQLHLEQNTSQHVFLILATCLILLNVTYHTHTYFTWSMKRQSIQVVVNNLK